MDKEKVQAFMKLAGQQLPDHLNGGDEKLRELGARLLLSEVLEFVIVGLGVTPEVNGQKITDPDGLHYRAENQPDAVEMLDGLADVAYTMYWNALAFGLPLDEGFERVCDNNLEKFVRLDSWANGECKLEPGEWDLGIGIEWPQDVVAVETSRIDGTMYAVGKDQSGKVRKPSSYEPVNLSDLVANA